MARDRDDDITDEPRRPRDDDDRPRRRDRDDDDYEPRRSRGGGSQLTGMDALFANTNIVLLILFACLCNGIALVLGIVGLVTCKDEKAKSNAMITTVIGGIITALAVVAQIMAAMAGGR